MTEAALASQNRLNLNGRQLPLGSVDRSLDQDKWVVLVKGQIEEKFPKNKLIGGLDPDGPALRLQRYREANQPLPRAIRTDRPWEELVFIQKATPVDSSNPSGIQSKMNSVDEASPTSELS